jgi:hypothetical protein
VETTASGTSGPGTAELQLGIGAAEIIQTTLK